MAEPLRAESSCWRWCPASTGAASTTAATVATSMAASFLRIDSILWTTDPAGKRWLRDVAELHRVRERTQLLQALVLDLADSLARHVERPADLVEGARMLAVEAVTQLEHLALAARECAEDLA